MPRIRYRCFPPRSTVRLSTNGTSNANPSIFGTSTQNLSCPQSGIVAKVSSTTDGTGKVLVDNYLNLTLTQGGTTTGPTNICSGGVSESGYNDCFTTGYQTPASNGQLTNQDPNGAITAAGGVGPIDISTMLVPGANTLKFDEVDTGGYLAASSIYLNTNCTAGGTSGGGTITGTPISSTNPTTTQLTQDFTFSGTTGKVVGLVFDLSTAQNAGTLTITDGTTPNGNRPADRPNNVSGPGKRNVLRDFAMPDSPWGALQRPAGLQAVYADLQHRSGNGIHAALNAPEPPSEMKSSRTSSTFLRSLCRISSTPAAAPPGSSTRDSAFLKPATCGLVAHAPLIRLRTRFSPALRTCLPSFPAPVQAGGRERLHPSFSLPLSA